MREIFPGFYRPTEEEFAQLWASALIVPDTNILLTLYRLSESTRGKLLQILEELKDRLFVPYQVAFEFQKNRIGVIDDQKEAYQTVEKQVQGVARQVGGGMGRHPRLDKKDLEERISKALKPVEDHLAGIRADHPDPLADEDALGVDAVRDKLDAILEGCVGEPRDLDELIKVGRKRYERKQPPGYEDRKKDEPDRYGDLAIWLDMIEAAKAEKQGVIFVTEERKEDWWWKQGSDTFAPRYELVEEMRRETNGQRLYIYGFERFMKYAAQTLDIDISQDERDDVARAGDAAAEASASPVASKYLALPSGAVPYQFEDHTYFPASPASGFTEYPVSGKPFKSYLTSFNPGWTELWKSPVETKGMEAVLNVTWEAFAKLFNLPIHFQCLVTTPAGEVREGSIISRGLSATLSYPADFATEGEPEAGLHTFEWFFFGRGAQSAQKIAEGVFELEAPFDPGSEVEG